MLYSEFNEAGIPVFGLHGLTPDGFCECLNPKCDALYKHPKNSSWQNTPIWDDDQIEVMELTGAFDTGYGVLCKGILVIDVDARNGGVDSYAKLVEDCPEILDCGLIVETGSGGGSKHLYFKLPNEHPALQSHLKNYKGIDFKSSGFVVGAGSMHKSGNRYKVVHGSVDDIEIAPKSLLKLLEATKKENTYQSSPLDEKIDISEVLEFIENDGLEYDEWIAVGMAIHEEGGSYEQWATWSSKSSKHDESQMRVKWESFGKNPSSRYTAGTLVHMAQQNGYVHKQKVDPTEIKWENPKKTKSFDPTNPPHLVGKITKWMNKQSIFPRENLAVAAALMAVSNAAGLRFRGMNNTTANLFIFAVAGSGTGKERIMQSYTQLMRKCEIVPAVHGNIISEQEIVRNIVDHQASFYTIDEFGETLAKIQGARKKGGSHLEGVIGTLMNVYSKANGIFLVPQTHKKKFKSDIINDIAIIKQRVDNNESMAGDKEKLENLKQRLEEMDMGIVEPYVNILGFTAPTKFNGLLDEDLADNGFFGRSIIVREMDDNPREREDYTFLDYKEDKELEHFGKILYNLFHGGYTKDYRVHRMGEITTLPASDKIVAIQKEISEYFWQMGEEQKEKHGFVAYTRRGAELVNKIALVLSVSEGEITEEAILWAFEYVKQDMRSKISLTSANTNSKNATGLMDRISTLLDEKVGMSLAQLKNKIRNFKPEDIEAALVHLERQKAIYKKEVNPKRGASTIKYFISL